MTFSLTTLGVSSASPTTDRYPSAHILNICGRLFLIDCGEGCQMLMKRHGISLMRLDGIFLSHIHGDHVFGIFGLLSTLSMSGRTDPVHIYAPVGFRDVLEFFRMHFLERECYPILFHPLSGKAPEVVLEDIGLSVTAFPLMHRVPAYGYLFREQPAGLNVRKEAVVDHSMTVNEILLLKSGWDVSRHEATFGDDCAGKAAEMFHSTAREAAGTALRAGAGKLVIGHFSSRYKDPEVLLSQAREVFPPTYLAYEGAVFDVPVKKTDI